MELVNLMANLSASLYRIEMLLVSASVRIWAT